MDVTIIKRYCQSDIQNKKIMSFEQTFWFELVHSKGRICENY